MSNGNMKTVLNEVQIEDALTEIDGWEYKGNRIERTFKTGSFVDGLDFIKEVTPAAEELNHHPDVLLTYPKVKIQLWTHDVNGITQLDMELARRINEVSLSLGFG